MSTNVINLGIRQMSNTSNVESVKCLIMDFTSKLGILLAKVKCLISKTPKKSNA